MYDGLGKRIKKITASETIVFVYDGLGKLIEEYSTAGPPQNPRVNYTATDPLGSPRVLTNENGAIISRRDFMPFGEEIQADSTYRTPTLKYGVGDNVRQKFTSYERDEETGLDFAEARYYDNSRGRFTAVDPLLASGKSTNPQTFNRYTYVMNRPLMMSDPTGLQAGTEKETKAPINVEQTPADTKLYLNEKVDGKYLNGVASKTTVKITDSKGKPIAGAKVEEKNIRKSGEGTIIQNERSAVTDKNGEYADYQGRAALDPAPDPEATEDNRENLTKQINGESINSVVEQTLTISTPDGAVYQSVADITTTNLGRDGKPKKDLNKNHLNVDVSISNAKITVIKPKPAIYLRPLN